MTEIIRIDGIDFNVDQVKLNFNAINVGGLPVPTKEIVIAIMKTMPDIESQIRFSAISNMWVSDYDLFNEPKYYISRCDPSAVEELELRCRLIEIDKIQCEITGFSFNQLRYVRALLSWHETLRGNDTSSKHTDRRKTLSSFKNVLKEKTALSSFKSIIKDRDYQRLLRFDEQLIVDEYLPCYEYSQAINYRRQLNKTIDNLRLRNLEIRKSVAERLDIYTKLSSKVEADPLLIPYLFCCPFCGKCELDTIDVKTPKSCNSPECVKAYSAATTKKSINQPYAVNKKSKKPASQWMKIDNIYRWCVSTCGKRRLVNAEQICKKCHDKPE